MSASITTNGMTARLRERGQALSGPVGDGRRGRGERRPATSCSPSRPGRCCRPEARITATRATIWRSTIEALSQGLSGHGRADPLTDWGASVYIQLMDPQAFGGAANFRRQTGFIADACRSNPPAPGIESVRLPGQQGSRASAGRSRRPAPLPRHHGGACIRSPGSSVSRHLTRSPDSPMDVRRERAGSHIVTGDPGRRTVGFARADQRRPRSAGRSRCLAALPSSRSRACGSAIRCCPRWRTSSASAPGDASVIATAFALAYGLGQLIWGALGDRFGKYRLVALMTLISALTGDRRRVRGLARDARHRTLRGRRHGCRDRAAQHGVRRRSRALSGPPGGARALSDRHHHRSGRRSDPGRAGRRAGRLARGLPGARRPVPADRPAAHARSALSARPAPVLTASISPTALLYGYMLLFGRPWARIILATVFVEGFLFYGAFTFIGAYLRDRFGLDYAIVGLLLGCFGVGGAIYAVDGAPARGPARRARPGARRWRPPDPRLPPRRLRARSPSWRRRSSVLGLGMYMLHATLQTNATQMAPEARGLAVSTFANALFLGQASGVWLAGRRRRPRRLPAGLCDAGRGVGAARGRVRALHRPPPGRGLTGRVL